MTTVILVCTHLLAFAAGAVMWRWIAALLVDEAPLHHLHTDERSQPVAPFKRVQPRRIDIALALVLIFTAVIIGFAVQQKAWQRAQDRHDACVDAWGRGFISSIHNARTANRHLARVTTHRDAVRAEWENGFGDLAAIIAGINAHPPTSEVAQFGQTLGRVIRRSGELRTAQSAVDRATLHVTATQDENPLPPLRCGH